MNSRLCIHLPKWLYELMPYIYVGGGIFLAISKTNAIAMLSGICFVVAGVQSWRARRRYRQQLRRAQSAIDARLKRSRQRS